MTGRKEANCRAGRQRRAERHRKTDGPERTTEGKKRVDRAPICDPAYLRRIDPLWMPGPVPPRFWEVRANRRDYLLWSAHRLGFRTMEDFYRLDFSACYRQNYGRGLNAYWGKSAIEAVQDCFPQYDWKPWLFTKVPKGFWESRANRRCYMDWLGELCGCRCMDDWYQVTIYDFARNRGKGIITHYHASPVRAVIDLVPGRNWCEWRFLHVPPGFWDVAENRHRYLCWLGKELGFRRPKDWYRIQAKDIAGRHGEGLLKTYSSLYDILREFQPQLDWDRIDKHRPMRIEEVLAWADAHHARHGTWPTSCSGEIPGTGHTWRGIDHSLRSGSHGLPGQTSLAKFLEEHRGVRIGRYPPNLTEEQVLAWADACFAVRGKWPTKRSGPIPGTRETWRRVTDAMDAGCRGFRRGSSLAKLLSQRCGVRNIKSLPPLKEKQILSWADAHFAAQGKWPTEDSGSIPGTGETWRAVASALQNGHRGFRRGSTLPQLLGRRRGVRNIKSLPPLKEKHILAWARAVLKATGRWPSRYSGPIAQSPGDTWLGVDRSLRVGGRGLPSGSSLARLLRGHGLK